MSKITKYLLGLIVACSVYADNPKLYVIECDSAVVLIWPMSINSRRERAFHGQEGCEKTQVRFCDIENSPGNRGGDSVAIGGASYVGVSLFKQKCLNSFDVDIPYCDGIKDYQTCFDSTGQEVLCKHAELDHRYSFTIESRFYDCKNYLATSKGPKSVLAKDQTTPFMALCKANSLKSVLQVDLIENK